MRKALNENPVVQVVMLGILGIVVAFLFMTRVMGGQDDSSEPAASSTPAPTATGTTPAPTDPATETPAPASTPSTETTPGTPGAVPGTAPPAPTAGFESGAGLPKEVVHAYDSGNVVAMLVVNRQGTEDRRLEAEVNALRGRSDVSVFVVQAKDVTRYSRIAEGVDLDRVPALVVVEPKRQAEGDLPGATISYGFRGPESVQQAVEDILYDGKELPYHPG